MFSFILYCISHSFCPLLIGPDYDPTAWESIEKLLTKKNRQHQVNQFYLSDLRIKPGMTLRVLPQSKLFMPWCLSDKHSQSKICF